MVYGWCRSKYCGWEYCLLYYKVTDFMVKVAQVTVLALVRYYAGIMLRGRGRHLKVILHTGRSY